MKRNLLVLMISTLFALAIMTACSPAAKTSTAVPSNATAPTAYPAKQEPPPQTAATAYPNTAPASSGKLTDEQVLALIETQLNGHHTLDFLLSKKLTSDQWVEVLNSQSHNDVILTPAELEQVIAYLIAHQK
jgi:hypothetical protein